MGEVKVKLQLINGLDNELVNVGVLKPEQARKMDAEALADSGARFLSLPEPIADQLGLRLLEKAIVTLGDGSQRELPIKGYVLVRVEIDGIVRDAMTQCLVGPANSPILLGQVPLEIMDLLIDCPRQKLVLSDEASGRLHVPLY